LWGLRRSGCTSSGNDLDREEQQQHPDARVGEEERDDGRGNEYDNDETTLHRMIAALTRSLAVGQFAVMREVGGEDEVEHGDGE
jgi:hypothetical protein